MRNAKFSALHKSVGTRPVDQLSIGYMVTPTYDTPTATSYPTVKDAVFFRFTPTGAAVNQYAMYANRVVTYSSLTPSVATVGASTGLLTIVTAGQASIQASDGKNAIQLSFAVAPPGAETEVFYGYASGSLAAHIDANIAAYVSGQTASSTTRNLWSSWSSSSATRNTSRVAPTLSLAASSFYRSGVGGQQFPVHLITPRHVASASHVGATSGSVSFLRDNGTVATANIVNSRALGNDITISYLDAEITGITPYKVMPSNAHLYVPGQRHSSLGTSSWGMPVLNVECWSGAARMRVVAAALLSDQSFYYMTIFPASGYGANYTTWSNSIRGGDSSGVCVVPITVGGTTYPVFVGQMWATTGLTFFSHMFTEVTNALNSTKSGGDTTTYALSVIDLSSFPTY